MLILDDGEDVSDLARDSADIRYVHIEEGRTIGEKRNFGSSLSSAESICTFDDDDWSAPDRLSRQVRLLHESGKSVSGFHSMFFTDGLSWWKYKNAPNYALGTSLCYRRHWWAAHPFKPKHIAEDLEFAREAHIAGQLISVDAGELMVATIHRGNTSPRHMDSANFTKVNKPDIDWGKLIA